MSSEMPSPMNMGFVRCQAGTDPAEGRKESGCSTGRLNSTFPIALQLLVALYERAHRVVQVPRKTPRHLAFAFQLLNGKRGVSFSPLLSFKKYIFVWRMTSVNKYCLSAALGDEGNLGLSPASATHKLLQVCSTHQIAPSFPF